MAEGALAFLAEVADLELRSEIRAVLRSLEVLSDVGCAAIGRSARSSEQPIGPPGFRNLKATDIPDEDRSLFEHYLARFRRLARRRGAHKELWIALIDAEDSLKKRTIPPTEAEREVMVAGILNRHDESALIKLIIEDHEGSEAYRVGLALKVPEGWVERVREDAGRDPDFGHLRPQWRELDSETKRSLVAEQLALGKTDREISRLFGIGERSVRRHKLEKVD